MEKVRAKFHCNRINKYPNNYTEVEMSAVYSDKGENKDFCEASPTGEFKISIDGNMPASDFFSPGKEYYLDIREAK